MILYVILKLFYFFFLCIEYVISIRYNIIPCRNKKIECTFKIQCNLKDYHKIQIKFLKFYKKSIKKYVISIFLFSIIFEESAIIQVSRKIDLI